MKSVSDVFVDYLFSLPERPSFSLALDEAELCLIDYLGCALAGAKMMETRNQAFFKSVAKQQGEVYPIGGTQCLSLLNAAFLNGMNAHATELDDGHRLGMIHLGASIFSALLPVSEVEQLSLADILRGTVVGYEAAVRLAKAMQPSHKIRGFHTSGTCGTIGTALAVAEAMHLSRSEMKSALSAAVGSASGLLELQENGSELKPYNLAHAAVAGIMATYAAKAGFTGPIDPLCGGKGMISAMSDKSQLDSLCVFDDAPLQIHGIYRKPYAACRHCHPPIEAALSLKKSYGIGIDDVEKITIETYKLAVGGHDHIIVPSISSAKLSTPFCVALALVKESVDIADFNDSAIHNDAVLTLANKVSVVVNDELTSWSPQKRAAIVHLFTYDGHCYSCEVDYPKGEPENPMSRQEVEQKYFSLASFYGLSKEAANSFLHQYLK